MTKSVAAAPEPTTGPSRSWRTTKKLDQWIAFWSVPCFFTVFGVVFVPLSWMMPPRSPSAPQSEILGFMHSHNLLIACAILT